MSLGAALQKVHCGLLLAGYGGPSGVSPQWNIQLISTSQPGWQRRPPPTLCFHAVQTCDVSSVSSADFNDFSSFIFS